MCDPPFVPLGTAYKLGKVRIISARKEMHEGIGLCKHMSGRACYCIPGKSASGSSNAGFLDLKDSNHSRFCHLQLLIILVETAATKIQEKMSFEQILLVSTSRYTMKVDQTKSK